MCAEVAPRRLEMMRRAVGLGSLAKMSWSIFAQICLYSLPGHRVISRWLGIPSDSLKRTGHNEGFNSRYSNGCVFVKERERNRKITRTDKRRWEKGRIGSTSKQVGKAGEAVRNKKSGSVDRVGSAMAHHQQGYCIYPSRARHTLPNTLKRTHAQGCRR